MTVDAPDPPNPAEVGRESLQAQIDLAGPQYEAVRKYKPLYAEAELEAIDRALRGTATQRGLLDIYGEVSPRLAKLQRESESAQREADVGDVERLAGRTVSAIKGSDPMATQLEDELTATARQQLAAGAGLDPSLRAELAQAVRAGQAARGFGYGNPDIIAEAFAQGRTGEQLRSSRQGFAQNVLAQRRASAVDPLMAILGRPSSALGMAGGAIGQGGTYGAGAPTFDPFNPGATQFAALGYQGDLAANMSNTRLFNDLIGAGIGAGGTIGGAWLGG